MQKKVSYSDLEPYGTIWNHMEPYGTLPRGKRRQKKSSYADLESYGMQKEKEKECFIGNCFNAYETYQRQCGLMEQQYSSKNNFPRGVTFMVGDSFSLE